MLILILIFLAIMLVGFVSGVLLAKFALNDAHKLRFELNDFEAHVESHVLDFENRIHDLEHRAVGDVAKVESTAKSL